MTESLTTERGFSRVRGWLRRGRASGPSDVDRLSSTSEGYKRQFLGFPVSKPLTRGPDRTDGTTGSGCVRRVDLPTPESPDVKGS